MSRLVDNKEDRRNDFIRTYGGKTLGASKKEIAFWTKNVANLNSHNYYWS